MIVYVILIVIALGVPTAFIILSKFIEREEEKNAQKHTDSRKKAAPPRRKETVVKSAPLSKKDYEKIERENDWRLLKEAGIDDEEIPFTEIIYNTDLGYGGKLITYNSRKRQFYAHEFMWHLDDSQEFGETKACTPEEVVAILQTCSHREEEKAPALNRVAALSELAKPDGTEESAGDDAELCKRMEAIADRAAFGFNSEKPTGRPKTILSICTNGSGSYHEEEALGFDETDDAYIFSLFVTAPMAYTGGWEVLNVPKEEIRSEKELNLLKTIIVTKWGKGKTGS